MTCHEIVKSQKKFPAMFVGDSQKFMFMKISCYTLFGTTHESEMCVHVCTCILWETINTELGTRGPKDLRTRGLGAQGPKFLRAVLHYSSYSVNTTIQATCANAATNPNSQLCLIVSYISGFAR